MGAAIVICQHYLAIVKQRMCNKMKKLLTIKTKSLIWSVFVLWYGYLLMIHEDSYTDHEEIGCLHVLTCVAVARFLFSAYANLFMAKVLRLLIAYGWLRILLCLTVLFSLSYFFVAVVLDKSALKAMDVASEFFISRYESNIQEVGEGRVLRERKQHSHHQYGLKYFDQLYRYPMEDVEMECSSMVLGPPGGRPCADNIEWRKDGVPLTYLTDRHYHEVEFTELPINDDRLNKSFRTFIKGQRFYEGTYFPFENESLRDVGLTIYEIKSKLSIVMLDKHEFGSYTCHDKYFVCNVLPKSDEPQTDSKQSTTSSSNPKKCKKKQEQKKTPKKKVKPSDNQCRCEPERLYLFQDQHFLLREFRLIRVEKNQMQIRAPSSSILLFKALYVELSADDGMRVDTDYIVNGVSFRGLCETAVYNGCSELQRVMAFLVRRDIQNAWRFLFSLPLLYRNGPESIFGHCLCQHSFGRHSVKYFRQYYNRTSKSYEHFEITHPLTLLVSPPRQNPSNFLIQLFTFSPVKILPPCDYLPDSVFDLALLQDFAVACATILTLQDTVLTSLVVISYLIFFGTILLSLYIIGPISIRLCLEGSMAYLYTAWKTARLQLRRHGNDAAEEEDGHYDIYLCLSESETDRTIVTGFVLPILEDRLGLKVCLGDRDLPPNEPELSAVSRAIANSKRFVVFLSKDSLQDEFWCTETNIIREILWERGRNDLLVVRLDDCEVAAHWNDFTIHNWASTNLVASDHQLGLLKWITFKENEGSETVRSALDVLMSLSPLVTVVLTIVVWWTMSY